MSMSVFHPDILEFAKKYNENIDTVLVRDNARTELLALGIEPTEKIIDSYISDKTNPDIDTDISCNLGDVIKLFRVGGGVALDLSELKPKSEPVRVDTIHSNITSPYDIYEDSTIECKPDVSWIIRDEDLHADYIYGLTSHMSAYSAVGLCIDSMKSMFPEPENISPKEKKRRNKESLNKFLKKGKKW